MIKFKLTIYVFTRNIKKICVLNLFSGTYFSLKVDKHVLNLKECDFTISAGMSCEGYVPIRNLFLLFKKCAF